jgi:glycosyltransferase involved in cell wall biosynthesis
VSHGDFTTNSGLHVHAIASELAARGYSPVVALPGRGFGLAEVGPTAFPVVSHRDARSGRLEFPGGGEADVVHAFTPRAPVRSVTLAAAQAAGCAYVVHLEDDDARIAGGTPAAARAAFITGSAGMTVVIERLLELKPERLPGAVVWPGFDESVLSPQRARDEVRRDLGVADGEIVLVYTGNVHETNLDAMRELYLAVALLRRSGVPAVLVKTGWNFVPDALLPRLGNGIRDLRWVARRHIPDLLQAADVLVQPGAPGGFDDYRFPSKLPDFLASGQPVVLPRTNIGLHLQDGAEALLLDRGDAKEIADKVKVAAAAADLRNAIGAAGQAFALRELRWKSTVARIADLYAASRRD